MRCLNTNSGMMVKTKSMPKANGEGVERLRTASLNPKYWGYVTLWQLPKQAKFCIDLSVGR